MILPNDTTVVVADGERIRLFRNKAAEPHISLVALEPAGIEAENRGSGSRHASSAANPDNKRLEEDDFAAACAEHINRQVLAGAITSLYIIADPRSLGEIRRHLNPSAKAALVGELAKDFTGHTADDIAAALAKA